jgi:GTP cyclohydrolase IA
MFSTSEPVSQGASALHRNGAAPRLAAFDSNAQVPQFALDRQKLESLGTQLLEAIGEDPGREGLSETPHRFAKWWEEFIAYDPGNMGATFEAVSTDQLVVISGIRVWSLCEHHLLPFSANITIGYLAKDKVLGLSKFARIAHQMARRLQIQERLVHQIADEIQRLTDTDSVAVVGRGVHLSKVMQGIKTNGTMTTSVLRGEFQKRTDLKLELFSVATKGGYEVSIL